MLRTAAASNNRDHARNLSLRTLVVTFNRSHVNIGRATTSQSLFLLLARATYIMVLFFTHIPYVVNHTIKATPPQQYFYSIQQYFYCNSTSIRSVATVLLFDRLQQYFYSIEEPERQARKTSHCGSKQQ